MGYEHIESQYAEVIEVFYERYFNPYLNFHRPGGVPEVVTNSKGKLRRVYRWYATPWIAACESGCDQFCDSGVGDVAGCRHGLGSENSVRSRPR